MRRSALLVAALAGPSLVGVAGGTTARAKLQITPLVAARGATVTVKGTGFTPKVNVTIDVGRRNSEPTAHWATVNASAGGGFRYGKVISRSTAAGTYVVVACQRSCRVKATATFRVAKVKPV